MTKIVSIALFGSGYEYAQYLPAFVLAHLNLFPLAEDWKPRIHVDDSFLADNATMSFFVARATTAGLIESRPMGKANFTKAMLWRMAPIFDDGIDYVFCRDLDAAVMPRDRACMETFMASKATVHTIHDNQNHIGIMGGLCGFRAAEFRKQTGLRTLDDLYKFAGTPAWAVRGADQLVLNRLVSARPLLTLLEHRYAGWSGSKPKQLPPHERGVYGCTSWSTPVPDEGWLGDTTTSPSLIVLKAKELTAEADRLGMHLGCAGYDFAALRAFWEEYGDQKIARQVRACEG